MNVVQIVFPIIIIIIIIIKLNISVVSSDDPDM